MRLGWGSAIIKMPYLNRLKQFLLCLMRNNLLLGNRIEKVENPEESKCYMKVAICRWSSGTLLAAGSKPNGRMSLLQQHMVL